MNAANFNFKWDKSQYLATWKAGHFNKFWCDLNFPLCLDFQIAAKIGGDGVAPPPSANDFGYGGQKRPLEDAGEFLMVSLVKPSLPFLSFQLYLY